MPMPVPSGFGPPPMGGGGFGPPVPPQKKSNTTLVVVVCLVVLAMVGVAFAVSQDGDDDESTGNGSLVGGDLPDVTTIDPNAPDPPDDPGAGDPLPDLPTTPELTGPPIPDEPELLPAEADVHDCIAVDSGGYLLGSGSCADGGTPYTVVEVVEATQSCSNPEHSYTPSGDYLLCLEINLVLNHCYVFPEGPNGGLDGWITASGTCQAPGTVHVIDLVPGASDDANCTTDYEWDYWYGITAPAMVACVMKY